MPRGAIAAGHSRSVRAPLAAAAAVRSASRSGLAVVFLLGLREQQWCDFLFGQLRKLFIELFAFLQRTFHSSHDARVAKRLTQCLCSAPSSDAIVLGLLDRTDQH